MALERLIDTGPDEGSRRSGQNPATVTVEQVKPIKKVGRRYSRFVGVMKVVLPVAAICLMVLIAAWPALQDQDQPMVEALEKQPVLLQVTNPVLVGTDNRDRPYSIVADRASEAADGGSVVELSRPEGEISTDGGARISLNAKVGRFDRESKQLHLLGDVRLSRDDGHRFATEEAFVDMDAQSAWGDKPVTGEGPMGEIQSEGFRIEDNGATVIFTGQSRAVLTGVTGEPAPAEVDPEIQAPDNDN